MAPKHHPTPLSGGDRKALQKELGNAAQSAEMRAKAETLLQQADRLLCESWNARMWSDGEPIDPSPAIDQGRQRRLPLARNPVLQDAERRRPAGMKRPPTTFVHDLASRLRWQRCRCAGWWHFAWLEQRQRSVVLRHA